MKNLLKDSKAYYEDNDYYEIFSVAEDAEHKVAEYLNNISNGFENAIQDRMKSERMKIELITNVSHDIKTPLTSIINYVDLLKRWLLYEQEKQKTVSEKTKV